MEILTKLTSSHKWKVSPIISKIYIYKVYFLPRGTYILVVRIPKCTKHLRNV